MSFYSRKVAILAPRIAKAEADLREEIMKGDCGCASQDAQAATNKAYPAPTVAEQPAPKQQVALHGAAAAAHANADKLHRGKAAEYVQSAPQVAQAHFQQARQHFNQMQSHQAQARSSQDQQGGYYAR